MIIIGALLGGLLLLAGSVVLMTWPAMLLFGAVHHDVFSWVPALSLWQTFLVVMLLHCLIPTSSTSSSD